MLIQRNFGDFFKHKVKINDIKIMSYLCADGSYMAGTYPDGKIYHAKSREDAVDEVVRKELKID